MRTLIPEPAVSGNTTKQALGGSQDTQFEQAFSSLAYSYIKDKAPQLLDYVVGFQLVERNEDDTKAVGVFGFQIGDRWLYIPAFFLNGDLKGHELLYIKDSDMFVPADQDWVDYILNRDRPILGEGTGSDAYQLGTLAPDIESLSYPPENAKYGSADMRAKRLRAAVKDGFLRGPEKIAAWAKPAMPVIAAAAKGQGRFLYPQIAGDDRPMDLSKVAQAPGTAALAGLGLGLDQFLRRGVGALKAASEAASRWPGVKYAMDRLHGQSLMAKAAGDLRRQLAKSGGILGPPSTGAKRRPRPQSQGSLIAEEPVKSAADEGRVRVLRKNRLSSTEMRKIAVEDREALEQGGYLVRDVRSGEEVSIPYREDTRMTLENPSGTGVYSVLTEPGTFEQMLVVHSPMGPGGRKSMSTLVLDRGSPREYLNAQTSEIYTEDKLLRSDFLDWFENLESTSLSEGSTYVAVGASRDGTCPFTIRESYGDGAYLVEFDCSTEPHYDPQRTTPSLRGTERERENTGRPPQQFEPESGRLILYTENTGMGEQPWLGHSDMHLPNNWKFVRVQSPDEGDRVVRPGNIERVHTLFRNKTAGVKVYGDPHEVVISDHAGHHRHNYVDGLATLMEGHGLSKQASEEVLKEAQSKGVIRFRVKHAIGFPGGGAPQSAMRNGPGPSAPAIPPPRDGMEQIGRGSVPSVHHQEEEFGVPGMGASQTDHSVYDPFRPPDPQTMQVAMQAAQSGQKEVFDTSMISGLLKTVRDDTMVDQYLGDLMSAVDRLGRLLFLFYWHGEQFERRYGKSDMPDLEDAIRNAFESVGEVVLSLKEKGGDPPGMDEMSSLADVAEN